MSHYRPFLPTAYCEVQMKKLYKDYWGQITVLFLLGLSLSKFTETLKMVFISQLDLN